MIHLHFMHQEILEYIIPVSRSSRKKLNSVIRLHWQINIH